jgi:predicted small metal-binding protein
MLIESALGGRASIPPANGERHVRSHDKTGQDWRPAARESANAQAREPRELPIQTDRWAALSPRRKEIGMAKVLKCRDLGVACDWEGRGATVDEVMQKAAEHARKDHGLTQIPPDMVAKAKAAVKDE